MVAPLDLGREACLLYPEATGETLELKAPKQETGQGAFPCSQTMHIRNVLDCARGRTAPGALSQRVHGTNALAFECLDRFFLL